MQRHALKETVMVELRQLQYFLAVAEQLNFSKAANLLYVTQPLLSQQIAEMEKGFRVRIIRLLTFQDVPKSNIELKK